MGSSNCRGSWEEWGFLGEESWGILASHVRAVKDKTCTQALQSAARLSLQSDFHNRYCAKTHSAEWSLDPGCQSPIEVLTRNGEILTGSSYRLTFHQTHMHVRERTPTPLTAAWLKVLYPAPETPEDRLLWLLPCPLNWSAC